MNANAEKSEPKPESKPAPKDDKDSLKTLAMPELMKKLGSSTDGLSQAEAAKRLAPSSTYWDSAMISVCRRVPSFPPDVS